MLPDLPIDIIRLVMEYLRPADLRSVRLLSRGSCQYYSLKRYSTIDLTTIQSDLMPRSYSGWIRSRIRCIIPRMSFACKYVMQMTGLEWAMYGKDFPRVHYSLYGLATIH